VFWTGHGGVMSFAISGLDIALWDLAGKLRGMPVAELLGGRLHQRFRACASVILDTLDLDRTSTEFQGYRARGYTAFKGGWGQVPEAGFGTNRRRDVAIAETVRRAVGDEAVIALDVSAFAEWTPAHACQIAHELEPFQLGWLEDALPHTDIGGYRRLRASTSTALATGERCWTTADYARLGESGAVDLFLLDPGRIEGITGMLEAATLANGHGVRVVPLSWSSAVNTAAALHVLAVVPNSFIFELKPNPSPMQHELVRAPLDQVDGWITVPDGPGLGIEIDEAVVREYSFD
jgi:L-alanine-DL-glutamate epimerase-like enolase superfamily enzyme